MITPSFKICLTAVIPAVALLMPLTAAARPGTLSQSPLFLASQVKSNIFFILDDSGSMDWEVLKSTGAMTAYSDEGTYPNSGNLDITPTRTDRDEILESCAGYNTLYYDPNVTYTPWYGVDQNGVVYGDQSITAARSDPYYVGTTTDLTDDQGYGDPAGYMVWNDDGDGVFEQGECPDPGDASYDYVNQFTATASGYGVSKVMTAAEQTNFANWYTYYRKREYVMKRAVSQLIYDSTNRMGLSTLHNNGTVAFPVVDMDAGTNKDDLLAKLFQNYSNGGTPLRWALEEAGEYYHQTDGYTHANMTSESSPILPESEGGACQQNFSILMSDGYWNGDTPDRADNSDGDDDTAWDGGAMADTIDDTLADVAMYYYENDLSALDDKVPTTSNVDENSAQHMVTFTVAFGLDGTLTANPPNRTDAFVWPDPINNSGQERIDDMRHAAYNSRGEFLNAKDPQELIDSLNSAVAEIESRVGSASSVSFNSSELTQDTVIYRASFNSSRWSGNLEALPLDPVTGVISSTPDWEARNQVDAQSSRVILTFDGTEGVPFTWAEVNDATSPITAALNDLKSDNAGGTTTDAEAEALLDYLRGDQSNEGTGYNFRSRTSRLGDIVHSSPVYVGTPALDWPDSAPFPTTPGETYTDFKNGAAASRQPIVYVGANDGMLHGFNTTTGEEALAYIPSILFSDTTDQGLHYLADTDYAHRYYVDLDPALSDAYIRTTTTGADSWRTILVGGLRAGGRGLYALDVTDPTQFSETSTNAENTVLWEFTNSNDNDLGHSFSQPTIALMNNGEWAAIVGNGYNDLGDGEAKLFILFLEAGLDGWTTSDYVEISTGVGNTTERNGLSTPAVADLDGDGDADRVYAGDLEGNMWVFDLSDASSSNWDVAYDNLGVAKPLFTTPSNQPITAKPAISKHPTYPDASSVQPNIMVYFSTGQYLTSADKTTTYTQAAYGVWDMGESELTTSDLVQQTLDATVTSGTVVTNNSVDYGGTDRGWYFNLPETGERSITSPVLWAGNAYFTSVIPVSDPCSYGASGILTALDMVSGGTPESPAFDANGDGVIDDNDKVTDSNGDEKVQSRTDDFGTGLAQPKMLGGLLYPDTGDPIKLPPDDSDKTGRLSWRELL